MVMIKLPGIGRLAPPRERRGRDDRAVSESPRSHVLLIEEPVPPADPPLTVQDVGPAPRSTQIRRLTPNEKDTLLFYLASECPEHFDVGMSLVADLRPRVAAEAEFQRVWLS